MLLKKIEQFSQLPEDFSTQEKAVQQSCFYNLFSLKKKISQNQSLQESLNMSLPTLPKIKSSKKSSERKDEENLKISTLSEMKKKNVNKDEKEKAQYSVTTLEQWKRLKIHKLIHGEGRKIFQEERKNILKNFRTKVQKNKQKITPVAKLDKENRYFEVKQLQIPKSVIEKIGLYEAGNIFKHSNINKYMEIENQMKPIQNTRYFNFNECTRNQLFLTHPKNFTKKDLFELELIGSNESKKEERRTEIFNESQYDTIVEDQSQEEKIHIRYWMLSVQNYEVIKNEQYFLFKVQNIEEWIDLKFILNYIIKYLKKIKISNLVFKFNKEEFMRHIWFGKKINFRHFQKLLNIKFQIKNNKSYSSRNESFSKLLSMDKIFNTKNEIIKEIVRIWKDRKFLNQKKNQKTKEKQIVKWIVLRFLAKISIKRAKKLKKKRALDLHDNFIKNGGNADIEIYLPSFSQSEFLRNTTQYMETFQNLYYHIWKENNKQTILVLPAINENLLNIYKQKIRGSSNITIICPESHHLFPKTLPLAACLLFSTDALSRIQKLIAQKTAIIIPGRYKGLDSYYELTLSQYLNAPLYCSLKKDFSFTSTKKLFGNEGISIPTHKIINQEQKFSTLIKQFVDLLMKNPQVNTWVLKMNGQFNGRGIATFSTKTSKKLSSILSQIKYIEKPSKLELREMQERSQRLMKYLEIHFKLKLKINFENCIFRVEEYIKNFLKVGGIIEQFYENFDSFELFFNYTPQKVYKQMKGTLLQNHEVSLVSFCQSYQIDFMSKVSTFSSTGKLPKYISETVKKIDSCLLKNGYQGYITVNIIGNRELKQTYVIDMKPFMTINFSLQYFLSGFLVKIVSEELQMNSVQEIKDKKISAIMTNIEQENKNHNQLIVSDGSNIKIIRQKLNFYLQDSDNDGFTCLFIPIILFTDVDEVTKAQLIEELVIENWDKIDKRYFKEKEKYENSKHIYMSLGLTLSLLIYGRTKYLKKMKKAAIEQIRSLSDRVANVKLYRGKQEIRDVFQFGDVIRAITKIRA